VANSANTEQVKYKAVSGLRLIHTQSTCWFPCVTGVADFLV